jgi:hypothetical protein
MPRPGRNASLAFLALLLIPTAASQNFDQCLARFKELNITAGGTDYDGKPVANPQDAVGLTYTACVQHCNPKQESFDWTAFSQQFSSWLLPWLALVSQLPFGAKSHPDNLISGEFPCTAPSVSFSYQNIPVALTVGSPILAAFSLALTAINTRWANDRFSDIKYPNNKNAVIALAHLQQVPLRLTTRNGRLASLIVLPENDDWWECLVDRLEHTHTWTIATAASMAWVVIAFVLAFVDSSTDAGNIHSNGQGIGLLWLWLISIVVGWLWIPLSSYNKLRTAIDKANNLAIVAASDDLPQTDIGVEDSPNADRSHNIHPQSRAYDLSDIQAVTMSEKTEVFTEDIARTAPVFNYARIWEWWCIVEVIAQAFEHADRKARGHTPVDPSGEWVLSGDRRNAIHRDNRTGTIGQVQAYCGFTAQGEEEPVRPLPPGVWKSIFVASVFALGLQWGTTGSAVMIAFLTPTTGLGCRSGSYILYGIISTTIWLALLLSSYLAHYARTRHHYIRRRSNFDSAAVAQGLATSLRRLSIFAASFNTLWIIFGCVSEFSKFYNTCYCNSSVLGRGAQNAYNTIVGSNHTHLRAAWIGGFIFAGSCVVLYLFFLGLMLEPYHDADDH